MKKIKSSEITSENAYLSRRDFLKCLGIFSGTAALLAACQGKPLPTGTLAPGSSNSPTEILKTPQPWNRLPRH